MTINKTAATTVRSPARGTRSIKRIIIAVALTLIAAPLAAHAQSSEAATQPAATLSATDADMLERGEYSTLEIVGSGVVGTFLGLGIGQAIQGRYGDTGWIFTVGELGSFAAVMVGAASCADRECNTSLIVAGVVGAIGFRVWELIDVWTAPLAHNRRVRSLRNRSAPRYSVFAAPTGDKSGVMGLSLSF